MCAEFTARQGRFSSKGLLGATVLLMGLWVGKAALADAPSTTARPSEPIETVTRDMHPAGPTVRREWRHSAGATPFRIEIEGARSGTLLVGAFRLRHLPDGAWVLASTTPAGEITQTVALTPQRAASLKVAGHRWKVDMLKETTVTPQPGIATEAEPSLDLRLTR